MNKAEKIFTATVALSDVLFLFFSYILSSFIYLGTLSGERAQHWSTWSRYAFLIVLIYSLLLLCVYFLSNVFVFLYHGHPRKSAWRVIIINTIGIFVFYAFLYLSHLVDVSRFTIWLFYMLSTSVIILKDYFVARYLRKVRRAGKNQKQIIILGAGPVAREYVRELEQDITARSFVVGYITSSPFEPPEDDSTTPGPYLGDIAALETTLRQKKVDEVDFAFEAGEYDFLPLVMQLCDKYGTVLKIVPFFVGSLPRLPRVEAVGDMPVFNLRSIPLDAVASAALKRAADLVVSLVIIILTSWLLVLLALCVKFSSSGPVFYKQQRLGRYKKPFTMLKFRSMYINKSDAYAWSTDNDPRRTKLGSFMRKYSLDELPQFFNVIKGDMSIVGPRPEIEYHVSQFREKVPLYMLRHQVRPGITGWAQVNGLRGDTSIEDRIEYDLYYIENWTFSLDVKIFFMTLFGAFRNSEQLI